MNLVGAFTVLHVVISLVAIGTGFVAMAQMLRARATKLVTVIFLSMTMLTSLTGFGLPATQLTPAHVFGFISLVALATAIFALSAKGAIGNWAIIYILSAVLAQYLNVFVLIIQSFQKLPPLREFALLGSQYPVALVQISVATCFIVFTIRAILLVKNGESVQMSAQGIKSKS